MEESKWSRGGPILFFCVGLKLCRFNPFQSDVGAIEAQLDLQIPAVKRNPNHAEPMTREDLAKVYILIIDPSKYILPVEEDDPDAFQDMKSLLPRPRDNEEPLRYYHHQIQPVKTGIEDHK